MRAIAHPSVQFLRSDPFFITGSLKDIDGTAYNLTGADLEWSLVDTTSGLAVLKFTSTYGVPSTSLQIIGDPFQGHIQIFVNAYQCSALQPGRYIDRLRVVIAGVPVSFWYGEVDIYEPTLPITVSELNPEAIILQKARDVTVALGDTWIFNIPCRTVDGSYFRALNTAVLEWVVVNEVTKLRILTVNSLDDPPPMSILSLRGALVSMIIPVSLQTSSELVKGNYQHEFRVTSSTGEVVVQSWGRLAITESLYLKYPI